MIREFIEIKPLRSAAVRDSAHKILTGFGARLKEIEGLKKVPHAALFRIRGDVADAFDFMGKNKN